MSESLKIIFAGTPEFAAASLQALLDQGKHQVIAVYSQPDRPAGRGQKLLPSPVKKVALDHQIPVYQPLSLKTPEAQEELRALGADLMVVAAYGLILPKVVLDTPRLGCINVHASLLPRWRGAAPIQRAIAAGDAETGITIMQMDVGLDTGAMLHKLHTPIHGDDTGGSLHDRLATLGAQALLESLENLAHYQAQAEPQDDSLATYAHKLDKDEARIDWQRPAVEIERMIRAFNPWPVAFTEDQGERIRIWAAQADTAPANQPPGTVLSRERDGVRVACGQGVLTITQLQLPGARAMTVADFLNGGKPFLQVGSRLDARHD